MTRYLQAATVAAVVCVLAIPALTTAHAAPSATPQSTGEVDRNLLKPPPGGVLAPVKDVASKLLPKG
ncbi:hypothetical protein [Streptomyces albipurpureus]|uniref:Secreted protein n=1 Tax=Streptomyces albipurpureus TaxID=2897419 RepID=A0ABT0UL04_9ACTN|nr:hypothetical protein [Streptomyces sp. CWNU-1]MCM2389193.1 hypothetical protein [Streptomyces sp. CWNU-1]